MKCISFFFLYKWLFCKINLLCYWFCLFFFLVTNPPFQPPLIFLDSQHKILLHKTKHTVPHNILWSHCLEVNYVFFVFLFLNMLIKLKFYWCLQNKCKCFIYCVYCSYQISPSSQAYTLIHTHTNTTWRATQYLNKTLF